jgi:inner membrane protein
MRVAWNTVSIIDPLFTLPVLALILLAAFRKKVRYARIAFFYAVVFLALGLVQHKRAEDMVYQLAQQRGHQVERTQVKPSFGNRHIWKLIYEFNGKYYVDAVRLLWHAEYIEGTSVAKLDVKRDYPWLPEGSQQAIDIERFRWFSDDYLAVSPENSNLIMDVRYSYLPNRISSIWGIQLDRTLIESGNLEAHVTYEMKKGPTRETVRHFMEMVFN